MANVAIIGGVSFGTAMACVVRRAGHEVLIWAREHEVVAAINDQGVNTMFLPDLPLVHGIRATANLAAATHGRDFVLMAVPAQHLREVAGNMRASLRESSAALSCTRG